LQLLLLWTSTMTTYIIKLNLNNFS